MNRNRSFSLVKTLALAAGALCLSASLANAQSAMKGEFTLPFEIHWGRAVLPAGQYSFDLPSLRMPEVIQIRGEGEHVLVMAQATSDRPLPGDSALVLVRHGDSRVVRSLRLAPLGISLYYAPPRGEAQTMAQVPELIQRLPVKVSRM